MKVLIACEFSGVVRRAFREAGHNAWSCDLLPAEDGSEYHIQGDISTLKTGGFPALSWGWDMMIAHPPCTYLCNSGVRWLAPGGELNGERHALMQSACDFFALLYWADIPRVAVENPVMHRYAKDYLLSAWKVPAFSQSVHPWHFGHGEVKRTCFWLRGLPLLTPTNIVAGRQPRVHHASPSADRWKERSRTVPGIALAMAQQWTI